MTQTLPLSEVKARLSQLVAKIISRDAQVVITRNGKPAAVLISAEEYEGWKETQEIKQNPQLMREIKKGLAALQKGKKRYSLAEFLEDTAAA